MTDHNKTREQLVGELREIRQRIAELEAAETKHQQIAEALRESEGKFRDLYENAPTACFSVGVDGIIHMCNKRAAELLGWSIEELVGCPVLELYADTPQGKGRASHLFERFRAGEAIVDEELQMQKADGTLTWVSLTVNAVRDARGQVVESRSMAVDITERKQAEEALEESEAKFRTLFETMAQGVVYQDADGEITSANPAAERILGLTLEQMQGRTSRDPRWKAIREDGSDFPGDAHPAMEALRTGRHIRNVVMGVLNPRKENYTWISVSAVPEFRSGRDTPYQVYTTFEDITHRKRAEEQLKVSLREKEAMLVEIHHRVRNNLQTITSLLDFQASLAEDEQVGELLRDSIGRVRSMALIHNQLYQAPDLARIDFAGYVETLTTSLFAAYRVDPVPRISLKLDVHDVFLEIREAIPCGLLINELISNALKHAFPASWEWPLEFSGEIRVSFRTCGEGRYLLVVSDNGVGLPADFQFPGKDTVGMLLTHTIVKQLGGSVEWHSEEGTTCRILIEP
jgi:PAS domain S-box-containing protein